MSEELKPCGYCHSEFPECFPVGDGMFQVACSECAMRGPRYPSRDEAVAAWNTLPRRAEIERLERERDWITSKMEFMPCYRGRCPYPPEKEREVCMKTNKLQCWKDAAEKEAICPR